MCCRLIVKSHRTKPNIRNMRSSELNVPFKKKSLFFFFSDLQRLSRMHSLNLNPVSQHIAFVLKHGYEF